jgi:hypothetical protein
MGPVLLIRFSQILDVDNQAVAKEPGSLLTMAPFPMAPFSMPDTSLTPMTLVGYINRSAVRLQPVSTPATPVLYGSYCKTYIESLGPCFHGRFPHVAALCGLRGLGANTGPQVS